jgi:hypothetical protein
MRRVTGLDVETGGFEWPVSASYSFDEARSGGGSEVKSKEPCVHFGIGQAARFRFSLRGFRLLSQENQREEAEDDGYEDGSPQSCPMHAVHLSQVYAFEHGKLLSLSVGLKKTKIDAKLGQLVRLDSHRNAHGDSSAGG